MIIAYIISTLVLFLNVIFGALPAITTLNITVGTFSLPIDTYLSTGMGYIGYIEAVFPPLMIMHYGFMAVLVWKGTLLVLRVFHIIR